jgi:DNA-binding NtrC family response regulator
MSGKVLIIETDQTFRQSLAQWISSSGFEGRLASDGPEGEEIAREEEFAVVIIGLLGLGREGLGVLRMIKELHPLTEVILIAGHEQLTLSIEGMKLGAFDDLRAPIDMGELVSRVRDACLKRKHNLRIKRRSVRKRLQDLFVAATYAEAGEFEAAREILDSSKGRTKTDKPDREKHDA